MDNRRIITAILAVVILAALGYLCYVIVAPKSVDRFTEFYILNRYGEAGNYPRQVVLGQTVDIIVVVVNHEGETADYHINITIDGISREVGIDELAPEVKLKSLVSLRPQQIGEKQAVEFQLYKNGETEPYFDDPLRLYIDVLEPSKPG